MSSQISQRILIFDSLLFVSVCSWRLELCRGSYSKIEEQTEKFEFNSIQILPHIPMVYAVKFVKTRRKLPRANIFCNLYSLVNKYKADRSSWYEDYPLTDWSTHYPSIIKPRTHNFVIRNKNVSAALKMNEMLSNIVRI